LIARSMTAVDITSMLDGDDLDDQSVVFDSVEHAIVSSPRRVQRCERFTQRLAHPLRILGKSPNDELESGGGDCFGKSVLQRASRRPREDDVVRSPHLLSRPLAIIAARTSSAEETSPASSSAIAVLRAATSSGSLR